jgi:hypothetical protein
MAECSNCKKDDKNGIVIQLIDHSADRSDIVSIHLSRHDATRLIRELARKLLLAT